MRKLVLSLGVAALGLSACAPTVPDSAAGVGFGDYADYQRRQARDAQLEGRNVQTVQPPADGTAAASSPQSEEEALAAEALAATGAGPAPLQGGGGTPVPDLNNPGISDENSFEAVAERETIESDAARIEANRQAYRVLPPEPVTEVDAGPNIVRYALQTTHPVGTQMYSRGIFNTEAKFIRNCATYPSADQAQIAFLAKGGPEKDRDGLDPDGDGFACSWSPEPFRRAVGR